MTRGNTSSGGRGMGRLSARIAPISMAAFAAVLTVCHAGYAEMRPHFGWTDAPALGSAIPLRNPSEVPLAEGPLLDGISFQTLADMITAMAAQDAAVMRGAQEIAIF